MSAAAQDPEANEIVKLGLIADAFKRHKDRTEGHPTGSPAYEQECERLDAALQRIARM